jgi:hypothetical protein
MIMLNAKALIGTLSVALYAIGFLVYTGTAMLGIY